MAESTDSTSSAGTVIVTGGAGFIGTAIAGGLADAFSRVIAFDNLHPQIHSSRSRPDTLDPRVELFEADITDPAAWDRLLADVTPEVVVHLAAETGTGQSLEESTRHALVNVVGTTQMLDALNRHKKLPRRIVLTSSRAVYGEGAWVRSNSNGEVFYPGQRTLAQLERGEWDFAQAEPTAMRAGTVFPAPVSVYGATKLTQEDILRAWALSYGVEAAVLRLQNVYGPGQSLINPYTGIMSLFCRLAKEGASIPLYEDGEVRRDFIIIDDVARAVLAATLSAEVNPEAIDIGSGEVQTIATAASIIADYYGAPEPHVTGQFRNGDVRHAWADVTVAKKVLGWEPRVSLRDGIRALAEWIDAEQAAGR
ncbi:NAD-dependent epimerase/dehydratase family protein [Sanguibacter suarezii]|uniref:NAD-dependent epimerase/dehydratase family protein n=1 Tax=Sanguibacter suarezii TaxID=60921 RepID=UPI00082D6555|nr:NAD-dependent epimerase/dehydratase family protein [Sanguibacter suarezii]